MSHIDPATGFEVIDFDGHPRILSCLPPKPDFGGHLRSAPSDVIPMSEWKERSMFGFGPPVLDQNGYGSCFPPGTRVRLADGSEKPIEQLKLSDHVVTAEGRSGDVTNLMVRRNADSLVNIYVYGHTPRLRLTEEHPILTARGYVPAGELHTFDRVALPKSRSPNLSESAAINTTADPSSESDTHVYRSVTRIAREPYKGPVYNISVEGDESYVAEGIGVHNCVGHGATTAFTTAYLMTGAPLLRFSACFLYGLINGGRDGGAIISDALDALIKSGICLESQVPEGQIYQSRFPKAAFDTAAQYRVKRAVHCATFEEMGSALLQDKPLVFGIRVNQGFGNLDSEGVAPAIRGEGNHCLMAGGLVYLPKSKMWAFDGQNSWGPSFGDKGHFRVTQRHFETETIDAFALEVTSRIATADDPNLPPVAVA